MVDEILDINDVTDFSNSNENIEVLDNKEDEVEDIFNAQDESIEVLDEQVETKQDLSEDNIISIDSIIPTEEIKEEVKVKKIENKKRDTILTVQIILLITWAILTTLIYFFGYNLFSPFIPV